MLETDTEVLANAVSSDTSIEIASMSNPLIIVIVASVLVFVAVCVFQAVRAYQKAKQKEAERRKKKAEEQLNRIVEQIQLEEIVEVYEPITEDHS